MEPDSLQDKKHISGLYGARGYEFERAFILSQLPDWLASDDLDFFQQELWSDLELFFKSEYRWLIQIKNHPLELTEFRSVIMDFQTRNENSNGQYEKYVIVSTGAANSVREIWNILERWREVQHLSESELSSTKTRFISKLDEYNFADLKDFLLNNADKIQINLEAGWVKDESLIKEIFISKLKTNYEVEQQDAENLYLRVTRQLAVERGKRIELLPLRNDLSQLNKSVSRSSYVPPFILPQLDVSTFTGRTKELKDIEDLLLKSDGGKICSIVGLAGTGGIGKSALACHFAELHKGAFPDGVIGIRVDGKDTDTIAREFARLCGEEIKPEDERSATTIMQEVFGHRRMLLIYDNAEDASIESLRPGGSTCAVIITTRDRQLPFLLDVPPEGRIDLPPLPYLDGRLLLKQLVGSERVVNESKAIDEVIYLVGSLPLALQIVGATLQMQEGRSIESYASSLREERVRLEKLKVRGVSHLDVRASFSLSLRLLEHDDLDFFACLSVCAQDGFSLQAAMAAGGCGEVTAHERLGHFYRLSLLNRPQSGAYRFVFHPLIRLFAQELLVERSLQAIAAERHARFYIQLVKSSDVNNHRAASTLVEELDDVILAAEWLQQQETPDYNFVIILEPFLQRHGHWQQAINLMKGFLSLAERVEDWRAVVQLHIQHAKYLTLLGDFGGAVKELTKVEGIIGKIEAHESRYRCEAMWLNTLGGLLQRQGRFDEAIDILQRSAQIEEQLGNLRGQAKVLNSLGSVLQRQGDFEAALDAFRRSAELEEVTGNKPGQAIVLNSLGGILQRQGRFDAAAEVLKRSALIQEQLGDRRGEAMVLNSLGGVLQRQGRFDEAVVSIQQSAEIEEQIGNKLGQAKVLNSLGGVFQRQGRFDEAVDAFERSYKISEELNDERSLAMVLNSLGGVFQRQGRFDEAVDAFKRSCDISEQLKDTHSLAMALNSLGGVLQRQGHFDEAADTLERSYGLLVELGDQRGQAMVLNSLGGVFQRQGCFNEAADAFKRSADIGELLMDKRHVAMVLNSLGGVLQRQGRFDEAIETLRRSASIEEETGNKRGQAMVLNSLGGVFQRQGRFDEAVDAFERSYSISVKLNDSVGLAMVHFGLGKAWSSLGDVKESLTHLCISFEINESLKIRNGIAIVTPLLLKVLTKLGQQNKALNYYQRALTINPHDKRLLELKEWLIEQKESQIVKRGSIKNIIRHSRGHRYGFILPDDGGVDIYFHEIDVAPGSLADMSKGTRVEFHVVKGFKGPQAKDIRII